MFPISVHEGLLTVCGCAADGSIVSLCVSTVWIFFVTHTHIHDEGGYVYVHQKVAGAQEIRVPAPTLLMSPSLALDKSFSLRLHGLPRLLRTLREVMDPPDILSKNK